MLYVSDSKVDALWGQVAPPADGWRTTKVRASLSFLEVERGPQPAPDDRSGRFGRLEEVLRYLFEFGDVGDVDDPGQFFGGVLPMRWGPYPTPASRLLFFGGRTERTVVGLGGSVRHALDHVPQPEAGDGGAGGWALSPSALPSLLDGLASERPAGVDRAERALVDAEDEALAAVREAAERIRYPRQNVEFVAKRLLWGPSPGPAGDDAATVLLGTPLYVAAVD